MVHFTHVHCLISVRVLIESVIPEEGVLSPIHPGAQGQTGILSKRWNYQREHQRQEDEAGWKHDLSNTQKQLGFNKPEKS